MEGFSVITPRFSIVATFVVVVVAVAIMAMARQVNCQISTQCTVSMLQSFTPCMNYVTGSSRGNSGISPTDDCCASLKSIMVNGIDCFCLIVNGGSAGLPFIIPFINTTLVAQLPVACNTSSAVPFQCKAMDAPIPAPADSDLQSPTGQPWTDHAPAATPPGPVGDGPISTPHDRAMTPEEADVFPMAPPPGVVKPADLSFALSSNSLPHYHYFLVIVVSLVYKLGFRVSNG